MFSSHRGSTILPVTSTSGFGPLYWVASSATSGTYYVKLANYGTTTQSVTVKIPDATSASATANLIILTGASTASNYPNDVTVMPTTSSVTGSASGGWTFNLAGYGVAVLTVTT
jgi:alpha-N-arabinofuranosidase